jgi:hypothetical protein
VNTTHGYSFSKIPIGDIKLFDEKHYYKYNPKEDITAFELSKIMHLMFSAMGSGNHFCNYDYWSFIMQNGLERHFDKESR